MEVNTLDKNKAKQEAAELQKKYADEQERKKQWSQFKGSYYWGLMMTELDAQIDREMLEIAKPIVGLVSAKDFEEYGKLQAVKIGIYEGIKKIKQAFIQK